MKKSVWISVIVLVAATALVIAGASFLLRDDSPQPAEETSAGVERSVDKQVQRFDVESRPDCPAGGVGGFDLPCLGGETVEQERKDITVAVVWAHWCPPCREELPMLNEFMERNPEWEVLGVHSDPNDAAGAALLNELGAELPSFQDSKGTFAGLLGLPPVVPVTVVFAGGSPVGIFPNAFTAPEELEQAVQGVI